MRWVIAGLCVMAAACSGQELSLTSPSTTAGLQAEAGTELPFRGSFTRQSSSVLEPPSTRVITATQTGTATHLGQFTAASVGRSDPTNPPATGTWDFTAANGDRLLATTRGAGNEFVPPNVSKATVNATIVGGTGRFAGATGSFVIQITEAIDFATSTATGTGSFEGTISLNR